MCHVWSDSNEITRLDSLLVGWLVGWMVDHIFLKGREVTLLLAELAYFCLFKEVFMFYVWFDSL